jgi:hypothetical protein
MTRPWFSQGISVCVPVTMTLLISLGEGACQSKPPATEAVPVQFSTASSVRELMQSIVAPSAEGLWDSVGTISNSKGTFDLAPHTDAEWAAVRRHAVALIESSNLLLIRGRHIAPEGAATLKADDADPGAELQPAEIEKRVNANWPAWTAMAYALRDGGTAMLKTIDAKDAAGLESTGSDLDGICENCHLAFWYPPKQAK